ncbi:hypothetical protein [Paramicrobacterium fandaimingii]|uniref:hypothetical protein n=1 Tax=Paramicrobacterium fandaimingii TaxID=2708079 RepID=UPI00141E20A4|nr:hypothetical protein [Microbacterium fandaimingii]
MEHQQSVRQWARTVELSEPLKWGELEEKVLEFHISDEDIAAAATAPRGPGAAAVVLAYIVLWVPYLLAPIVGLVLVIIALGTNNQGERESLMGFVQICFIIGLVLIVVQGVLWVSTRDRSMMSIGTTIPVTIVSLAAYLLIRPEPGASWTALIAFVSAILGVVVLGVTIFASKPTPRLREKWKNVTPEHLAQKWNRAVVLEELSKRGIISDKTVDVPGLVEMPIGTWNRMDERLRR